MFTTFVVSEPKKTPPKKTMITLVSKEGVKIQMERRAAKMSDLIVETPIMESVQLMKTIYEQYSYILFDYVTESVVSNLELDRDIITHNHSILE